MSEENPAPKASDGSSNGSQIGIAIGVIVALFAVLGVGAAVLGLIPGIPAIQLPF